MPYFVAKSELKEVFKIVTKTYSSIIYEKKTPIAYITLNRPEKVNSLTLDLQMEVRDALYDAGWRDDDIRVIVIKGAGRGFSAGYDLSESDIANAVQTHDRYLVHKGFESTSFWDVFWNNRKPLIAQVHGFCVAGGCATASFCDLCICSEDALFGAPEVRFGGPYMPAIWPWILGPRKTRELLYTGNLMDAQEAWRLGLVNKVVPKDKLDEEVNKLAQTIAKVPLVCVEYSKKLINNAYELMNIHSALERSGELESIVASSPESSPEIAEYRRIKEEQGLKAALAWSSARFSEEDAWFKKSRRRV